MTYIRSPIETSQAVLADQAYTYIMGRAPNWVPNDGNLDVWIIQAMTQLAAENRSIASDVQDDIFRWFGATLMGIQPGDAVEATGFTTWTMIDSLGHTIPEGTAVSIKNSFGDSIAFVTTAEITVPAGNAATASGEVPISALIAGAVGNGLGSAGEQITLIDVLDWVQTVTITGTTSGGADAEDDPTYLSRLVLQIKKLSYRPILPADFSSLAQDVDPTIDRVVTIDGYNSANSTYNNERMVAVAAIQSDGQPVSAAVKSAIDAYLQSNREINFVVNLINPSYTTINVVTTVLMTPGFDSTSVHDAIVSALQNYFSPSVWGAPQQEQSSIPGILGDWTETPTVYYNEVVGVISGVTGVRNVTSLTINGGTANINLTTPAALTQPGTMAVTVT